ncbi:unnamed protein product, partial [Mesorhabditis belari]|uniref:Major sperm protein n=1 Tax=Mesorhabditis belari TaxID=2138241 RepID=A0AAF3E855_9BILA
MAMLIRLSSINPLSIWNPLKVKRKAKKKSNPHAEQQRIERANSELQVDKEVAIFLSTGGTSEHVLWNRGGNKLAFKVRCSNNKVYRVTPVHSVIEPGECLDLVITRSSGAARTDKLVVEFLIVEPEVVESDVREMFHQLDPTVITQRLRIALKAISLDRISELKKVKVLAKEQWPAQFHHSVNLPEESPPIHLTPATR